jgi:(1->4)-alpha-D-glucan 1-alpha-D-glucosylmutase
VTRLAGRLQAAGGFGDATVHLPEGSWRDALSGTVVDGGPQPLTELVGEGLPVALLLRVRADHDS